MDRDEAKPAKVEATKKASQVTVRHWLALKEKERIDLGAGGTSGRRLKLSGAVHGLSAATGKIALAALARWLRDWLADT